MLHVKGVTLLSGEKIDRWPRERKKNAVLFMKTIARRDLGQKKKRENGGVKFQTVDVVEFHRASENMGQVAPTRKDFLGWSSIKTFQPKLEQIYSTSSLSCYYYQLARKKLTRVTTALPQDLKKVTLIGLLHLVLVNVYCELLFKFPMLLCNVS
jgi:hypothetical protein